MTKEEQELKDELLVALGAIKLIATQAAETSDLFSGYHAIGRIQAIASIAIAKAQTNVEPLSPYLPPRD